MSEMPSVSPYHQHNIDEDIARWQEQQHTADQGHASRGKMICTYVLCMPLNFLFFLCLLAASSTFLLYGLVPLSEPALNTQYNLGYTFYALMPVVGHFAAIATILPLSYWAGTGNARRWLVFTSFTLAAGSFFFSLPHLVSPAYSISSPNFLLCAGPAGDLPACSNSGTGTSLFLLGLLIIGIGVALVQVIGPPLLHASAPKPVSACYIGFWYACCALGATLPIFLFESLRSVWVGFPSAPSEDLTPHHPLWVHAWWLGFLCMAALVGFLALAVSSFPEKLPRYASWRGLERPEQFLIIPSDEINDGTRTQEKPEDADVHHHFPEMPGSLCSAWRHLYASKTYRFGLLAQGLEAFVMVGIALFTERYFREIFFLSEHESVRWTGTCLLASSVLGALCGGWLIRQLKLTALQVARLSVLAVALSALFLIATAVLPCQPASTTYTPVAGNQTCNQECVCAPDVVLEVCDASSRKAYQSPCMAGCQVHDPAGSFSNCACVGGGLLWPGPCNEPCSSYSIFFILTSLIIFFTSANLSPSTTFMLRSVPVSFHYAAMGIRTFVYLALGSIPAPFIFLFFFMDSCRNWVKGSCGRNADCTMFHVGELRRSFYLVLLIPKLVALWCLVMSYKDYLRRYKRHAKAVEITILEQQRMRQELRQREQADKEARSRLEGNGKTANGNGIAHSSSSSNSDQHDMNDSVAGRSSMVERSQLSAGYLTPPQQSKNVLNVSEGLVHSVHSANSAHSSLQSSVRALKSIDDVDENETELLQHKEDKSSHKEVQTESHSSGHADGSLAMGTDEAIVTPPAGLIVTSQPLRGGPRVHPFVGERPQDEYEQGDRPSRPSVSQDSQSLVAVGPVPALDHRHLTASQDHRHLTASHEPRLSADAATEASMIYEPSSNVNPNLSDSHPDVIPSQGTSGNKRKTIKIHF